MQICIDEMRMWIYYTDILMNQHQHICLNIQCISTKKKTLEIRIVITLQKKTRREHRQFDYMLIKLLQKYTYSTL